MSKSTVIVDAEQVAHGQVNADIRVVGGGHLIQHGQVNGDILVEADGTLDQHGQVNGDIRANENARIRLWGQVNGSISAEDGSDFRIAEGVMVMGSAGHRYVTPEGSWEGLAQGGTVVTRIGAMKWRLTSSGELVAV
jgi:cytoskeletal protein CcmA (bactofilin family)